MSDEEKTAFIDLIEELDAIRVPRCTTVPGIMLAENLQGWIKQLKERVGQEVRGVSK